MNFACSSSSRDKRSTEKLFDLNQDTTTVVLASVTSDIGFLHLPPCVLKQTLE